MGHPPSLSQAHENSCLPRGSSEPTRDYPQAFVFTLLVLLTEPFVEGLNLMEWNRTDSGIDQAWGCGGDSMLGKLFDTLFGCAHSRYGFPITIRSGQRRNQAAFLTGTYVVCLDCGREMPYDWNEMRVIASPSERRQYLRALTTKEAA